ncbi:YceI family protein [Coralloluteibacterium stylophorae]|uniref:YceI family protein n=1 Tax=Coralloluteibacterium stylophorae TaxID=1776034 RepID=A0A8J7VR26_9GAMM|nr:YceI family protein [Coralloluteibacterium stylophorae]MBS7456403.1 YceI family protein [Coralloluteibacterium stylophorae]
MILRPLLVATLFASGTAAAADYTAVADRSTLGFASSYEGEAFEGRFPGFSAEIAFDPAAPAAARFDVAIPVGKADTGVAERDETLVGADFFASDSNPTATFVSSGARVLGGGRFATDGTLTLRGTSRPVTLEFAWTPGARPELDGTASVPRLAFDVGGGDWADTGLIPDEVAVRTHLVLQPVQ